MKFTLFYLLYYAPYIFLLFGYQLSLISMYSCEEVFESRRGLFLSFLLCFFSDFE